MGKRKKKEAICLKLFWLNLLALIAVVAVNALANIVPFNGQTTGEISDKLNVLFTPAGYVFSIWGLIYFLLAVWVLRGFNKGTTILYKDTHVPFLVSCLLNITWIVLWHYEFFASSVAVIIGLLLSLIVLYKKIERQRFEFWDRFPFSVYLGWVSVAVIANISYTLTHYNWNGFGISAVAWTILLIVVAAVLAISFRFSHHDRVYPLVFVWALIGIAVRNWTGEPIVSYMAIAAAIIVLFSSFLKR